MTKEQAITLLKLAGIILCLYLFIVGIGAMGHSFKLFGKEFSEKILTTTSSPLIGLFIGVLATSLVQSSSTTTSIIVGLVAGGAVSIEGAIPMVMGANVGTTITNTLVSMGHITRRVEFRRAFAAATVHDFFNLITLVVLLPLQLYTQFLSRASVALANLFADIGGLKLGSPLKAATKPAIHLLSQLVNDQPVLLLIAALLLTFAMLAGIVKLLRSMVLERVEAFFDQHLFSTIPRALIFGVLLTATVQSSSITTSLVIPLVGAGLLSIRQVLPYTMGANVGTTITAMLAALSTANVAAISVAFAHLLFNISGIVLILPFERMRRIPIFLAEGLAEISIRNRLIPFVFVGLVFFVIPLSLIFLTR
ncbi:MAG: Na/Pi symporter [Candidatus Marinimicrobia bacterium]|nr:Na/Pi symporter [Candidatus Neomarinimicrobiota bacterium]